MKPIYRKYAVEDSDGLRRAALTRSTLWVATELSSSNFLFEYAETASLELEAKIDELKNKALEVTRYHAAFKALFREEDFEGYTSLDWAIAKGHIKAIQNIQRWNDLEPADFSLCKTNPLLFAATYQQWEVLNYLLNQLDHSAEKTLLWRRGLIAWCLVGRAWILLDQLLAWPEFLKEANNMLSEFYSASESLKFEGRSFLLDCVDSNYSLLLEVVLSLKIDFENLREAIDRAERKSCCIFCEIFKRNADVEMEVSRYLASCPRGSVGTAEDADSVGYASDEGELVGRGTRPDALCFGRASAKENKDKKCATGSPSFCSTS